MNLDLKNILFTHLNIENLVFRRATGNVAKDIHLAEKNEML
jgi:hypothetical protein